MILVIAEQRAGRLSRASWEAISAAQALAAGAPIEVVVLGTNLSAPALDLARAAVRIVHTIEQAPLDPYTPDGHVQALHAAIALLGPRYVMLPHTYQTRDFVAKLAARLGRAVITDCVAIRRPDHATVSFVRPTFQGRLMAEVVPEGEPPHFITTQVGAFSADAVAHGAAPALVAPLPVTIDAAAIRERPEAPIREAADPVDLSQAERIVAVGRGIRAREHVALAERLARVLGAEVGASRPICDAGWMPLERQIGSSGQTVAPKLYLALGISGAIQHLIGMKGARTIVAINKDVDAPIFEIADYGIAADLFEVVPAIIAALEQSSPAPGRPDVTAP
jgi:electron transfer flavoprotein alpha subunit